jgi:allantoin racemase
MRRILVIVPFPLDDVGIENRRRQLTGLQFDDVTFDYQPVLAGPATFDSYHDLLLADVAMCEAGLDAQKGGYDAVCVDTVSDSGVAALRSVLDIPVIGPGRASFAAALMLGGSFSVITVWEPWTLAIKKGVQDAGMSGHCASVRFTEGTTPDVRNLLGGKEEEVFPKLQALAERCIDEDGADAIILGSTTMHEVHDYLASRLPVPVINPGPLSYKVAAMLLDLGLSHGRHAYDAPRVPQQDVFHAMLASAKEASVRAAAG